MIDGNWDDYETHIGWEEVPVTRVCQHTIFETLFEDWLESIVTRLIEEAE